MEKCKILKEKNCYLFFFSNFRKQKIIILIYILKQVEYILNKVIFNNKTKNV